MTSLDYSDSIQINASAQDVYAVVSDVTRTGEWSPICQECWWNDGEPGAVGSHFTGRNVADGRTWETTCTVVAAEPGREFTWHVGEGWVRWSYTLDEADGSTTLTESWNFLPAGIDMFHANMGDDAQNQIDIRSAAAHDGIPKTLEAIKHAIES